MRDTEVENMVSPRMKVVNSSRIRAIEAPNPTTNLRTCNGQLKSGSDSTDQGLNSANVKKGQRNEIKTVNKRDKMGGERSTAYDGVLFSPPILSHSLFTLYLVSLALL